MMPTTQMILDFVKEKKAEHYDENSLIFLCPGGSFLAGTNDEHSDFDFRAIALLDEDHYFGLRQFDHQKMVSGTHGINRGEDMDVEVFELFRFLQGAINGEIIPFEMLYADQSHHFLQNEAILPVIENRHLFLSRRVVAHYFGFIKKCIARMKLPAKTFDKDISKMRVESFGFETKEAMNAVKLLRLTNEMMQQGTVNLYRSDRDDLMAIKRGEVSRESVESMIANLLETNTTLFKNESALPRDPDFDALNQFYKSYKKKILQKVGL